MEEKSKTTLQNKCHLNFPIFPHFPTLSPKATNLFLNAFQDNESITHTFMFLRDRVYKENVEQSYKQRQQTSH